MFMAIELGKIWGLKPWSTNFFSVFPVFFHGFSHGFSANSGPSKGPLDQEHPPGDRRHPGNPGNHGNQRSSEARKSDPNGYGILSMAISGTDWLEVPTTFLLAYFLGLWFRGYTLKIWPEIWYEPTSMTLDPGISIDIGGITMMDLWNIPFGDLGDVKHLGHLPTSVLSQSILLGW